MTTTSLYIFKIQNIKQNISSVYEILKPYVEDSAAYFNLNLISNDELSGEYVYVQNIEQAFYNVEMKTFEVQIIPKATVVPFEIENNCIFVWANRTNVNKLLFKLTTIFHNISFSAIEPHLERTLEKIGNYNTKISKVSIEDVVLFEDIVGTFSTDLYSYGDSFSVLKKYKDQLLKLSFQYYSCEACISITLNKNGGIIVYKSYKDLDNEQLNFIREIFL